MSNQTEAERLAQLLVIAAHRPESDHCSVEEEARDTVVRLVQLIRPYLTRREARYWPDWRIAADRSQGEPK